MRLASAWGVQKENQEGDRIRMTRGYAGWLAHAGRPEGRTAARQNAWKACVAACRWARHKNSRRLACMQAAAVVSASPSLSATCTRAPRLGQAVSV